MDIKLNKDYRLVTSSQNITLVKRSVPDKGKNKGEDVWTVIGYHGSNIRSALIQYFKEVNFQNIDSLEELISKYDECIATIKDIDFNKELLKEVMDNEGKR